MTHDTAGVDVSKDWLDAHRLTDGASKRFANTPAGRRALIRFVAAARVAFESSGVYHQALERELASAGIEAVKINPLQARRFAEATGTRAKTDAVDARVLARMAAMLDLEPTSPLGERMLNLKELQIARQALVKDRTAAKNRAGHLRAPLLKKHAAERLAQIQRQLAGVDAEIAALIEADPDLIERRAILSSIPGVSSVTAAALLIEAPELGALDARQAASLAGVAPITRQSGQWTGRARIRGGRAHLRHALYMPALVAARYNDDLKTVYERLRAAGKPPKVALTALMRKPVILANALLRDRRAETPRTP